jgi:hypothetical protein
VAEQLGEAVLSLSVDLEGFKKQLDTARSIAEKQKPVSFKFDVSNAQQQFRKLETSAKTLEAQFNKLLGTPLNLNAKNLEKLGSDVLKAGTSINDFTRSVINGEKPLANSVASLQQQGQAFRTLAANVKIGSAEFRNFTQATAQASQKQLFAGFEEIKSLQSLFKLGSLGEQSSFKGTEDLLAFSRRIGDTPAAINLYTQALQQALSVTSVTDANFAKLTAEIERQASALERAQSAASRYNQIFGAQPKALPPGQGPSQFVFSAEETAEERRARERRERRAGKIQDLQTYASTGGRDPLAGFGRLLTAPNDAAIRAEQQLAKTRLSVVDATTKATAADARQAAAARKRAGGGAGAGGIISSALIGGAFPLLFGQGGGAAGGGLIGGLLGGALGGGGGFAGSLVGTLVGQTADKFGELAKALQDPVKNLDALIQGANLSGKGVEELAKVLVELGRTSEANALIQADLAQTIDPVGVVKVAAANDAFARSVGDIQERIGYLLAGPATQFIGWIDQVIQRVLNLPASGPTQRGALATRGQGAALGVGGVLLGAAGLAAAPFTGGASLPLALGGLGLAAAGGTQIASAGFQEGQIADSAAIEKIQGNIAAIEERRVRLQRDITAAVRTGRKNAEAELRLQDQLLQIDAQKEQLKAAFQAGSGSAAELRSLKAGIAALNARKEAAIEAENQRQVALKATAQLDATQAALALQSVKDRLSVAEQLSAVEQGIVRSTLEQALNIQNGIAEARRREQDLGAQITAARQVGDETAAARLVGQQQVAAEETKLRLVEGATALKDAGIKLREDVDAAFLNLQKLRTGAGGLNQFLSPQDRVNQERRTFEQLLPRFREAQAQFRQLRGVDYAPEFTGTTAGINQSILQFIDAVKTEQQAVDSSVDTQRALNVNTEKLATVNADLAAKVAELNAKEWVVQVNANVPYDAQSQLEINRAASLP